jgi:hypothetical protein
VDFEPDTFRGIHYERRLYSEARHLKKGFYYAKGERKYFRCRDLLHNSMKTDKFELLIKVFHSTDFGYWFFFNFRYFNFATDRRIALKSSLISREELRVT